MIAASRRWLLALLPLSLLSALGVAPAADASIYLKINGIPRNPDQGLRRADRAGYVLAGHEQEPASRTRPAGLHFDELDVTKHTGQGLTAAVPALCSGTTIPDVLLNGDTAGRAERRAVCFENVLVSSLDIAGNSHGVSGGGGVLLLRQARAELHSAESGRNRGVASAVRLGSRLGGQIGFNGRLRVSAVQRLQTPLVAALVALLVGGAGGATAAKLLTGKDVKDGSLSGKDLKDGSVSGKDLATGPWARRTSPKACCRPR